MPRLISFVIIVLVINLIWPIVTIESSGHGHEHQKTGQRLLRRFPFLFQKEAASTHAITVSNTTNPHRNESSRIRMFSAEEHAQHFSQYEVSAARVLIQNLLHQNFQPPRSDRARMAPNAPGVVSFHDGEAIATIYTDLHGNISRCNLFEIKHLEDSERILAKFAMDTQRPVQKINFRTMLTVITACQAIDPVVTFLPSHHNNSLPPLVETERQPSQLDVLSMRTVISGILPGTKWCGLGDIAQDYEDLGQEKNLDKCCRAHDHCPTKLRSFRSGYGLINWSLYTKSHCDCDSLLYECLKKAGSSTADLLGTFYFNVLQVQCIDEEVMSSPTQEKVMFFRDVRRQF